jgi:hypothetical protein
MKQIAYKVYGFRVKHGMVGFYRLGRINYTRDTNLGKSGDQYPGLVEKDI